MARILNTIQRTMYHIPHLLLGDILDFLEDNNEDKNVLGCDATTWQPSTDV